MSSTTSSPAPACCGSAIIPTTTLAYDGAGQITKRTDPRGNSTTFAYDQLGNLVHRDDPVTNGNNTPGRWSYEYDPARELLAVTDPTGARTEATYDDLGHQITSTAVERRPAAAAYTTTRAYDPQGLLTSQTSPAGDATRYGYDGAGQLTSATDPLTNVTTAGYDLVGRLAKITDPLGDSTAATYDHAGRMTSVSDLDATGATLRTYSYTYDAAGNRITDGTGAEAATSDKIFGYDLAGRRLRVSAPGNDILTTYNDRGLPLTVSSPTGQTTQNTYDGNGRLTARVDAAGKAAFTYNGNDQLTSATDDITGGVSSQIYDKAGRVTTLAYGSTGSQRTYTYDALDRVTSDTVTGPTSSTLASISYSYDKDDHLTGKTTTGTTGAGANTYDGAGRLTGWTDPTGRTTPYTWDAAGNRTSNGATYDQRNQLLADNWNTYTPRGTLASQTTGSTAYPFQFDAYDRMAQDSGKTYAYDALDRLTTRSFGGATSQFVYSTNQNNPAAILDGSGNQTSRYARDPSGAILDATANSTNYRVASDQHNDPTTLLSQDATTLTGSTGYDPFGTTTSTTGAHTDLGYQGGYLDPSSGRINMHARWYSPGTATFNARDSWTLNPDPSINANRYTYVGADPLDYTDPSGHAFAIPAPVSWTPPRVPWGAIPWGGLAEVGGVAVGVGVVGYGGYLAAPHVAGWMASGFSGLAPRMNMSLPYQGCMFCGYGGYGGAWGYADAAGVAGGGVLGYATYQPPPPPTPAQIQAEQAKWALDHPAPPPPTVNPIAQEHIDNLRLSVEKTVKVKAGTNSAAAILNYEKHAFQYQDARTPTPNILTTPAHPGLGNGTQLITVLIPRRRR